MVDSQVIANACSALDVLGQAVISAIPQEQTFVEIWGWNCPPINKNDLAEMATGLSRRIRELSPQQVDSNLERALALVPARCQLFQATTMQYIANGNASGAVPNYVALVTWIKGVVDPYLPPIVDWQDVEAQKLMPRALLRRLRSVDTQITNIENRSVNLDKIISNILDANEAAESLPTDMASIEEARKLLSSTLEIAHKSRADTEHYAKNAQDNLERMRFLEEEAKKIIENCEGAFSAATTKGLGEAFSIRARQLAVSMWVWVGGLMLALGAGAYLSHERVQKLQEIASSSKPDVSALWVNISLAVIGVAPAIWFAWISTKQIGQRFRLAEDYAFKASVAKAYAGYNAEAARIDPSFAARLFGSALNRIDEAPLRFVEMENHGSPFHEFLKIWSRKRPEPTKQGEEA